MNTDKIIKESKTIMLVTLTVGIILFAMGILFTVLNVNITSNSNLVTINRAFTGLSFIPLSIALMYYLKLLKIRKSPDKMRNIIINENDERLVALKNEAEAKAFKIIQGALFLTYLGYTFMVPSDIFESVGWWILLGLMLLSIAAQAILLNKVMRKEKTMDTDV
jgi:hypothetical protein